jgi:hypothetical protein
MKAITALTLLKKHELVHKHLHVSRLKWLRRLFGDDSWETFIQNVLAREYLLGNRDLKIPIIIPEVKMSIGGTLNLHTGELTGGE